MASDAEFVRFVTGQLEHSVAITSRKMFGEYAIYSNGKLVALICDNQLFVKQTDGGRVFIGDVTEASPYSGAKPSFLVEELDDADWLSELIKITERELPAPRMKRKKGAAK